VRDLLVALAGVLLDVGQDGARSGGAHPLGMAVFRPDSDQGRRELEAGGERHAGPFKGGA
jgi:hypothetical protein